jgi:hypothetical protein
MLLSAHHGRRAPCAHSLRSSPQLWRLGEVVQVQAELPRELHEGGRMSEE